MKMKKMLLGAFLGIFTLAGVAVLPNYANAEESVSTSTEDDWANPDASKNMLSKDQSLKGSALLDTVQKAINWVLAMLATVALVICLYGGFKMMTSAGDEKKYKDGLNVLKYAAIGLAIIGLSWLIVSVVFWFIGQMGGSGNTSFNN